MPRAALLSIHARVEGAGPSSWEDPSLVQLWGPRYQVYVIAASDLAVFSLGRFPDDAKGRRRAEDLAARLHAHLAGETMTYGEAGHALGVNPNSLRYAATTGTLLIRWAGARQPTVWTVPPAGDRPAGGPARAGAPLPARLRSHHARGVRPLGGDLAPGRRVGVRCAPPVADRGSDAARRRVDPCQRRAGVPRRPRAGGAGAVAAERRRLLPAPGDDRSLLVPDADRRGELWTPRVWPGAVLLDGEIRGTWRRAHDIVTVQTWGRPSSAARDAVEAEAAALPLPGIEGGIVVRWDLKRAGFSRLAAESMLGGCRLQRSDLTPRGRPMTNQRPRPRFDSSPRAPGSGSWTRCTSRDR